MEEWNLINLYYGPQINSSSRNDINNTHQDYVEQTDEELQNINEHITQLDNEMNNTKNILSTIQSDHEAIVKKNKAAFK